MISPFNHALVRRFIILLAVGILASVLSPIAQAQMGSDRGPSFDQLVRALPSDLPNYTREKTGRWEGVFAQAMFKRMSGSGPSPITVRLGHGRKIQAKVDGLIQQNDADTTTTADGRTVYAIDGTIIGEKSADLFWTHDAYTLWLSAKEPSDPAATHDVLKSIIANHIPADQLPEAETAAFPKPSLPTAKGFETPEGFSAITGQYGGGMDKAARISIAYPSDWTALDASEVNSLAKVLDISRKKSAAKARWYGSSISDGEVLTLHAPDEVHVQVAGPGLVAPFVGQTDPMGCVEPNGIKSHVKGPTVVQSPTKTTVAGNEAATMTVEGTSADGYDVRHRVVCVASNGAVPRFTVTRPTSKDVVSDDTIQKMLKSLTAEVITSEE
jgi:hypothetical protein